MIVIKTKSGDSITLKRSSKHGKLIVRFDDADGEQGRVLLDDLELTRFIKYLKMAMPTKTAKS